LRQGLLQGIAELYPRYVLVGGQCEAEDLVRRHQAPFGVVIRHVLGSRHAGVIDNDHFVARIGRAQAGSAAAGQNDQG
jgi:hypothetical protein